MEGTQSTSPVASRALNARGALSHNRDDGMTRTSMIYEPARDNAPFIVAIYDATGCIVASQGFRSHPQAEAFLQAFIQENAGEFELPTEPGNAAP